MHGKPINPKMLILAREARGYSQAELADKMSISQANYSRMEKGLIAASEVQIEEIADALDFPVEFFIRKEPSANYAELYYRKKATMPKKELYCLEAKFDLIRYWFNHILDEVDIPDCSLPEIEIEYSNTPSQVAQRIRVALGIPTGPIGALIHALEKKGIIVYFLKDAPEKFDGTTVITDSGAKVLVVNANMPNYRKRFTIAHELCHIVSHIPFVISDNDPYRNVEFEANEFAAEFLMPGNEIGNDLYRLTYSKLTDLKNYWNVAKSAIIKRASDLSCITKDKYTHLMIEMSRYGERRSERKDVPLDEPKMLSKMLETYMTGGEYSQQEFRKILAISQNDYNRYLAKDNIRRLAIAI